MCILFDGTFNKILRLFQIGMNTLAEIHLNPGDEYDWALLIFNWNLFRSYNLWDVLLSPQTGTMLSSEPFAELDKTLRQARASGQQLRLYLLRHFSELSAY